MIFSGRGGSTGRMLRTLPTPYLVGAASVMKRRNLSPKSGEVEGLLWRLSE